MPPGFLIPIGSDNQAVVLSYQHGRAKEPTLAAMSRLLWGVYATSTCSFYLRYVPSDENSSDGVSRLNQTHVNFLLSQNWTQLHLPDSFFSVDETNPFSYQEEIPSVLNGQLPFSKTSPLQRPQRDLRTATSKASWIFVASSAYVPCHVLLIRWSYL